MTSRLMSMAGIPCRRQYRGPFSEAPPRLAERLSLTEAENRARRHRIDKGVSRSVMEVAFPDLETPEVAVLRLPRGGQLPQTRVVGDPHRLALHHQVVA